MKKEGYGIFIFFLWLPSADFAVSRVANRVQQGGHNVPEPDVRRRFAAGLRNFFDMYQSLADQWRLFDASRNPPRLIAHETAKQTYVVDRALFQQIVTVATEVT